MTPRPSGTGISLRRSPKSQDFGYGAGLIVLGLLFANGCDGNAPYRAVLRAQTSALEELANILGQVTDRNSMKAATAKLKARFDDFEGVRQRAQKLPPPSQEVLGQLQEDGEKVRQALEKVQAEVRRISAVPGGRDFLTGLEGVQGFLGVGSS